MSTTLTLDQEARLEALVEAGDFPSVDVAARALLDERLNQLNQDGEDDLAWARPFVEEARAAVARGEVMSLDEFKSRTAQRLANLRKA
jgi:antitoxin ParD1/3/4